MLLIQAVVGVLAAFGLTSANPVEEVPIGTIFSVWDSYKDVFTAMQYALERHTNDSGKMFQFKMYADNIRTVDAYKLTRIVCRQFERGIYAMVGTVDPESFDTLHSYANAFEMPFVTPWFPESMYHGPNDAGKQHFAIQVRPDYHEALVDLITYYGWTKIIYIYSDFDGLLRLQRIFRSIPRTPSGEPRFHIELVRRVSNANEAIEFLLGLEKQNRDSVKLWCLIVQLPWQRRSLFNT
jgi:ionotropic glutamate receptor